MRQALIDPDAIRSNVETVRRVVAPARVMAVVKADGYGHGAVISARAAVDAGADMIGVVDVDEALQLRAAGIAAPVLAWLHSASTDFTSAIAAHIDLGISSHTQLERAVVAGVPTIHVKVDSGLSRNGISLADAPRVFEAAALLERAGRLRVAGVFSHLAGGSAAIDDHQLRTFVEFLDVASAAGLSPEYRHLAASRAAFDRPDLRFDMVRIGGALYGLSPDDGGDPGVRGLRPVMTLASTVVAVRRVDGGAGVSYSHAYHAPRATTLALVPLGYADGLPRAASGRAEVAIRGVRYPVAGRIAMDQIVVDIGRDPVEVGDVAVAWGNPADGSPSVEEWAAWAGTISRELCTHVGSRVQRVSTVAR